MWVQRKQIPPAIINKYKLQALFSNDSILVRISKGIYGLRQAGRLAQQRLIAHLANHGYRQSDGTPCLFMHKSRPIKFILVMDRVWRPRRCTIWTTVRPVLPQLSETGACRVNRSGSGPVYQGVVWSNVWGTHQRGGWVKSEQVRNDDWPRQARRMKKGGGMRKPSPWLIFSCLNGCNIF